MRRGRWKREHELPRFPFHCYTNLVFEWRDYLPAEEP